jgi:hypothetical protein
MTKNAIEYNKMLKATALPLSEESGMTIACFLLACMRLPQAFLEYTALGIARSWHFKGCKEDHMKEAYLRGVKAGIDAWYGRDTMGTRLEADAHSDIASLSSDSQITIALSYNSPLQAHPSREFHTSIFPAVTSLPTGALTCLYTEALCVPRSFAGFLEEPADPANHADHADHADHFILRRRNIQTSIQPVSEQHGTRDQGGESRAEDEFVAGRKNIEWRLSHKPGAVNSCVHSDRIPANLSSRTRYTKSSEREPRN